MPDLRTFRAAALATLVAVVGLAHADAPADAVARNAALHVEGIPPIPSALAAKIAPYTEFKPRTAVSWHPQRRELVVATRAVNTTRADRHDREEKRRARLVFAGGQRRSRLREEGERRLPVLCDGQLSRNDAALEVVRANADRARTPIAQPQEQGQAHPAPGIDALRGLRARLFEERRHGRHRRDGVGRGLGRYGLANDSTDLECALPSDNRRSVQASTPPEFNGKPQIVSPPSRIRKLMSSGGAGCPPSVVS